MNWLWSLVLVLIFHESARSQNLVLNPSFENVNISSLQCSWYTSAAQFNNAINNWTCPTAGSTDIYHTSLATSCFSSPNSTNGSAVGTQNPRTGNAFVNLVTYGNGGCTPYREYVQGRLSTPLVAGQTYQIEMYVTLADYSNKGTNNIGVKFTSAPVTSSSMCVYSATPDVNYTGPIIIDKTNWTLISWCFTPTVSNLEYLMIGNFYDDAATSTVATGGSQTTIRYFLDDVSVTPATGSSVNPGTNGTLSVCTGASSVDLFTLLGGTPDTGGSWSGPSVLPGGYLGTYDPSVHAQGTYTYTVGSVVCGNPTTATATVTVTFNTSTSATIDPAGPFCESASSAQLTAANPGGTWSATCATCITSSGVFDPSSAGQGVHQITYITPGACGDTGVYNISVTSNLDATIGNVAPLCQTASAVTLNPANPGGSWDAACGSCISSTGVFDPSALSPGIYWVSYTISGTCGDIDSTEIEILAPVDPTIQAVSPVCSSSLPLVLTANDPGGVWGASCGSCINSANGTFDPSLAGTGTHTVSYSIAGQCGSTDTEQITVMPQRDATINQPSAFCVNDNATVISSLESGGVWSASCGACIGTNGEFTPSAADTGSHWVIYSIAGTCGDIDSVQVQVMPQENSTITPVSSLCLSSAPIQLNAATTGGSWNASCGSCIDAITGEFDPAVAGAGTHTVTYAIAGQCGSSDMETVTVTSTLDATITPIAPVCITGSSVSMTANDPGGVWSATCGACISSSGVFDPSVAAAGVHTITYSLNGICGDTASTQLEVILPADATINPVSSLCPDGLPVTLTAATSGGTWTGPGITNASSGNFDPTIAGSGMHDIIYTLAGNCGNADTISVNVITAVSISASSDLSVCEGVSSTLQVIAQGGDGAYTYTWQDQSGNVIGNTQLVSVTSGASSIYNVTVQDGCSSSATSSITVNVTPTPDASFTASPLSGCVPLTVNMTGSNFYSGSCAWVLSNGETMTDCNSSSYTFEEAGCYDIMYVVDVNGCKDTVIMQDYVCATAMPVAEFTATPELTTILEPNVSFINESKNAAMYHWYISEDHVSDSMHYSHVFNEAPGTYSICLEAYTNAGCADSICKNIIIEDEFLIYVPNAFTPDNNGRNDTFKPVITGYAEGTFEMQIFNRWGNEVFTTKDVEKGWNGKDVQEDVYVWKLMVTSKKDNRLYKLQGTVTIVR